MKKLITIIAAGAFAFIGTTNNAEARPNGGKSYHQKSSTYVSGYRHGRPVYTQKIFVGYDHHGHPRYQYRAVSSPNYSRRGNYRRSNSCAPNYRRNSYRNNGYGNYRSSGGRVSFSFGR